MLLETTDELLNELFTLDARLARKIELAIHEEREAGYQEGWAGHSNWVDL